MTKRRTVQGWQDLFMTTRKRLDKIDRNVALLGDELDVDDDENEREESRSRMECACCGKRHVPLALHDGMGFICLDCWLNKKNCYCGSELPVILDTNDTLCRLCFVGRDDNEKDFYNATIGVESRLWPSIENGMSTVSDIIHNKSRRKNIANEVENG